MEGACIIQKNTLTRMVTDQLRQDILLGQIASGSRITVQSIAKRYNTSALPVREAMQILSGENLLEMSPYKGASVREINHDFVCNTYDLSLIHIFAALVTFALFFAFARAGAAVVAWGDKGDQVTLIQQKLKQYGYFSAAVDGVFGKQTYDAVVWFQRNNGLKVDGAVGESTAAALGITLSGTVAAAGYNESETYLLGRLVHGEARGEPYVGKVAVAAVVLNRCLLYTSRCV